MTQNGEVQGRMILSGSALILAEDHVELPMQIILDAPMGPAGVQDDLRVGRQRRDVEAGFT